MTDQEKRWRLQGYHMTLGALQCLLVSVISIVALEMLASLFGLEPIWTWFADG